MNVRYKSAHILYISLALAIGLTLVPLPEPLSWWRPHWVLLVSLFGCLTMPRNISLTLLWLIGLLLDVLEYSPLGTHGLALVIVCYPFAKFYLRLRLFTIWQILMCVTLAVAAYLSIFFIAYSLVLNRSMDARYILSGVTTLALWPWLYAFLYGQQGERTYIN